jgi:hypothetical protein
MFFFFHLFAGIVIGLLIGDLLNDRRWLIPCALGAVLPDLIDKPIGHILLADSIGYGRIYGHTILFFLLIAVVGIIVWKFWKTPAVCAVAVGVLTHDILDLMWREPENWFYPFLGPFKGHYPKDYMFTLIQEELNNPSEIIVAILIAIGALLYLKYQRQILEKENYRAFLKGALLASALALFVLGGIVIGRGMVHQTLPYTGWTTPIEYFVGGVVMVIGSYVTWRVYEKVRGRPPGPAE